MIGTRTRAAAAQDSLLAGLTAGGVAGTLRLWSGAVPANLTASPAGPQLVSMTAGTTVLNAFGATNAGTMIASGQGLPWSGTASASGTATYFRFHDSTGTPVLQGSVSASGGGGELILSSTTITAGATVTVTAFSSSMAGIF